MNGQTLQYVANWLFTAFVVVVLSALLVVLAGLVIRYGWEALRDVWKGRR